MGYVPPGRAPERLMLWGDAGSHKTSSILDIAKRLPDATFRIVECDWSPSVSVMLDLMPRYAGLTNVIVRQVFPDDFDGQLEALQWLRSETLYGDWAVFDSFSHTWEAAQQWFIEHQFTEHEDADAYYLSRRAEKTGKEGDLDGWMDWPYIKKIHNKLYREIMKTPGHFVLTMEQQKISSDHLAGANEEKALFAREKSMPRGRKQFAHVPRTILHLEVDPRSGEATYSGQKDRARELQKDHTNGDFFRDYMVAVAGWHLETQPDNGPSESTPQLVAAPAEGEA